MVEVWGSWFQLTAPKTVGCSRGHPTFSPRHARLQLTTAGLRRPPRWKPVSAFSYKSAAGNRSSDTVTRHSQASILSPSSCWQFGNKLELPNDSFDTRLAMLVSSGYPMRLVDRLLPNAPARWRRSTDEAEAHTLAPCTAHETKQLQIRNQFARLTRKVAIGRLWRATEHGRAPRSSAPARTACPPVFRRCIQQVTLHRLAFKHASHSSRFFASALLVNA